MRILTKKVKAKQLKPGDLFSTINAKSYRELAKNAGVGIAVYIRTEQKCLPHEENETMYKVEIRN